ncbi:MAG: HIT domain-containing protein [Candidatus Pacearchaeota archaeon]|jgi:histidine triad (HIT) family protein
MLPKEQIPQIKKQLLAQLDSTNLPNKEEIKKSIELMNETQLEEFLIQNNLIKPDNQSQDGQAAAQETQTPQGQPQQCVFCSIVEGKIKTYKIDENKDSIAALEINPVSSGHSIIIPKKHITESSKLPQTAFSLAKKIAKKIKTKLKPKDVAISSANVFGHEIINILPIYENETINSQRKQVNPEELEKLKKLLEKKPKPKVIRKRKTKKIEKEKLWLPKRIP